MIRGGTIVDGSGSPGFVGDVAIDGERLTAVGEVTDRGRREIDADMRLVTPGWVDMHTHYDAQVTWDPELTPAGWHGVTTVVMGNCGVGFAPAAPDRHDWLIELMEGVEDIPGAALHEGIQWGWESFPEYLDVLEQRPAVADFGTQVPHGALRAYVMGQRGADNKAPTVDDMSEMARLTREGLAHGALGFSTSRTPLHKSIHGELVPGTEAAPDELFAIADAIDEVGHGVFQAALHHPDVPDSFPWLRRIAEITGQPVTFNMNQTDQAPDLWRDVLALLEGAAHDGLPVYAQVAGRPVGILFGLQGTVHPFVAHATYQALADLALTERVRRLREPDVRARLVAEDPPGLTNFLGHILRSFDKMWTFSGEADYEPDPQESIGARAARQGRAPAELALDQLLADNGRGLLYFPLFNYSDETLDPLLEMHQHPRTLMGLADGGAHCGTICDGGMPTFMVAYWARDRDQGRLPLELVVHRQTRQTAEHYGLGDRGLLAPGLRADVNVIDFDGLGVDLPRIAYDLPTDAPRFVQKAHGYDLTICRGQVVAEAGEFTGATPGRLIRGPQADPR